MTENFSHGPIRVMVASADRRARKLLSWSLTHDGRFNVVGEASDGDMLVAQTEPYELALVDLTIPGLGILGVIDRLRRHSPSQTVVVMGYTDARYVRKAITAEGAADYLLLPDDLDKLTDRLLNAFNLSMPAAS